jgi:hypothetical protein
MGKLLCILLCAARDDRSPKKDACMVNEGEFENGSQKQIARIVELRKAGTQFYFYF